MPSKRRSPDHPVCFFGKLTLEFYNNDDEEFKIKALKSLAKEASREFNISCLPVEEHSVENPEFGTLVVSVVAPSHDAGKAMLDKALKFFDEKAPARIIAEDFEEAQIV